MDNQTRLTKIFVNNVIMPEWYGIKIYFLFIFKIQYSYYTWTGKIKVLDKFVLILRPFRFYLKKNVKNIKKIT